MSTDRPVIMYDQIGFGKSDCPTDPSFWNVDRFVEELGQVREVLKLDEVHILGHSWAYMLTNPTGVNNRINECQECFVLGIFYGIQDFKLYCCK